MYKYIRPHGRDANVVYRAYLASCDAHNKVHRGEFARKRKTILDELEDGESRRPYIRADSVFPPYDALGLGVGVIARRKHGTTCGVSEQDHSHRHVLGRPSESARTRADELAGNAKVTKFDHALA
jgi:hypothetical protein